MIEKMGRRSGRKCQTANTPGIARSPRLGNPDILREIEINGEERQEMNRALVIAVVVVFLLYLVGSVTKDQVSSRIESRVTRTERQMDAISKAARDYYRLDVKTREGTDPWSVDFQWKHVDELWPDLFSIVEDTAIKPTDPFDPEQKTYLVATQGNTTILVSVGPNQKLDVSPTQIEEAIDSDEVWERSTSEWGYSPTNGSRSDGDLFVVGQYTN